MNRRRNQVLAGLGWLALFAVVLIPRLAQLDGFITTDENRWVCRSINFRNALAAGDLAGTFQAGHPGVITMWIGSAVMAASDVSPDSALARGCRTLSASEIIDFQARPELYQMRDLLYTARRLMAVVLALMVLGMVWLTARLFGWPTALVAGLLLAFDPFLIAHSRVLHLDALTTSLMILSVLSLLVYVRDSDLYTVGVRYQGAGEVARMGDPDSPPDPTPPMRRFGGRHFLVLSGVLAGLAILNKTPGLFLAPALAAILGVACVRRYGLSRTAVTRFLRDGVLVAVSAAIVGVVFWPALWVAPIDTIRQVLGQASDFAVAGHEWPNYFLGAKVHDPGPVYYPATILYRTTPLVWIGVLGAILALVWPRRPDRDGSRGPDRWVLAVLFAVVVGFVALMTGGAKKFDRYVLEVFPVLDLLAAVGLVWLAGRVPGLKSQAGLKRWIPAAGVVALAVVQAAFVLAYAPYYLTYYNPLLGGPPAARRTLLVGWGEGLDQAAAYLNRQADAANLRVGTWYIEAFAPLFKGYTAKLEGGWRDPSELDYVLLYVNDVQRGIDQPAIDQFYGRQQPDHVVNIHGIDYVYVYRNPLRQVKTPQIALPVELGDGLRLLGYDLDTTDARPGGKLRANLYWQSERRTDVSYTVFTHLLDGEGRLIGQYDSVPLKGELPTRKWYSGQTVVDPVEIEIGTDAPPGPYSLAAGMYELESLQRLAAYDAQGQRLPGDQVVISGISPTAQP